MSPRAPRAARRAVDGSGIEVFESSKLSTVMGEVPALFGPSKENPADAIVEISILIVCGPELLTRHVISGHESCSIYRL